MTTDLSSKWYCPLRKIEIVSNRLFTLDICVTTLVWRSLRWMNMNNWRCKKEIMSQSQVYLFLYEEFDIWKWISGTILFVSKFFWKCFTCIYFSIAGQRRRYHAGVNLYGKEYCYTNDGILALTHVLQILISTFLLILIEKQILTGKQFQRGTTKKNVHAGNDKYFWAGFYR